MNSVILDEAEIGENVIVGANSTVKAKFKVPANNLVLGSPAKVVRPLEEKLPGKAMAPSNISSSLHVA